MLARMAAIGVAVLAIGGAHAQQVDMQAVMLWGQAKAARFHVVGQYDARTAIAAENGGYAQGQVTDGLALDFDWSIRDQAIIGEPKIANEASKLGTLSSSADYCKPPLPKGDYEHFTASKLRSSDGQRVELDGMRRFPAVEVAGCEADQSYDLVAGKDQSVTEYVAVPNPMMLAVPGASAGGGNIAVSTDRKSFIVKSNGWTWTYTPTPLP